MSRRYVKVRDDLPCRDLVVKTEIREVHRYKCPRCGYRWESLGLPGKPTPIACLECGLQPEEVSK
jgi:hypothetical protein